MDVLSLIIYTALNRYIGTEEVIDIKRRYYGLMERVCNLEFNHLYMDKFYSRLLISGSRIEGFDLPGCDMDVMKILKYPPVFLSQENGNAQGLLIETTNIKQGYARLRFMSNNNNIIKGSLIRDAVLNSREGVFLSSLIFRDQYAAFCKMLDPKSFAHGPCALIQLEGVDIDDMLCLSCKQWPSSANEWTNRVRKRNWPSRELVTDIVKNGCLLVPLGNPNSEKSFIEWRLSFSQAEKQLIHSMNQVQFLCYGLLKVFLKYVINSNSEIKDLLCSYYLKTSVFYCIEDENISWSAENFLECFWVCLRRLIGWVREGYCPNYFVKENNMFEGKIIGDVQLKLERYLNELYDNRINVLKQIPCLSSLNIFAAIIQPRSIQEESIVISEVENEYLCDAEMFKPVPYVENKNVVTNLKSWISQATNPIDKIILQQYLLLNNCILTHFLYKETCIKSIPSHRKNFDRRKTLRNHIEHNCMSGDKVTGMLQLATLCYLNGVYYETIQTVCAVLEKHKSMFEPARLKMKCQATSCSDRQKYMEKMCGKGLTMQQKFERVISTYCPTPWFYKFYPTEIEDVLKGPSFAAIPPIEYINPKIYSHVLLFLSHRHMGSKTEMDNALSELNKEIYDNNSLMDEEKPLAVSLLSKCTELTKTNY